VGRCAAVPRCLNGVKVAALLGGMGAQRTCLQGIARGGVQENGKLEIDSASIVDRPGISALDLSVCPAIRG
jgi:hypothetical protein